MEEKFQKIVDNFALKGKVVSFEIIDMGHINSTRKIIVDVDGKRKSYLLQNSILAIGKIYLFSDTNIEI